jgi:HK97 family phage major capsid protein
MNLTDILEMRKSALAEAEKSIDLADSVEAVDKATEEVRSLRDEIKALETALKEQDTEKDTNFDIKEARKEPSSMESTLEERKAFRDKILAALEGRSTSTSDVASVIPTQVMAIVEKQNANLGKILAKVTQTNLAAGVEYPIADLIGIKAVWVAEGSGSTKNSVQTGKVSFKAHKVRVEFSLSKEVKTMSLTDFEQVVAHRVVAALEEAVEGAILTGEGEGQPVGITKTGEVPTVDYEATYQGVLNILAELPAEYEANASFLMNKATFYEILGMVDTNGQPIARVNSGIEGGAKASLMGYEVIYADDYLASSKKAEAEEPVVLFGDLSKYALNTVYEVQLEARENWDTEDYEVKGYAAKDGHLLIPEAFVIAKKPAAKE